MTNLKKSLLTVLVLCSVVFSLTAQTSSGPDTGRSISQVNEENITLGDTVTPSSTSEETTTKKSSSGWWAVVKMIIVLVIVVGLIYLVFHFIKKKTNYVKNEDDYLRKVAYINIAPGKTVEVVTLLDKGYLIGVTEDNITMLGEINDEELIKAMNLSSDKKNKTKKPSNFSEVLDMFLVKKGKKEQNVFKEEELKVDNLTKNNNFEE